MQTFVNPQGVECVVFAPDKDAFSLEQFRQDFPIGGLYGLDTETTALDDHLRQFHPDFTARLIQFATEGYAWVLRLDDPEQWAAAAELLADPTTMFASHSSMDVLTVWRVFGLDIADRNVDTLILGKMAAPDDRKGGADLKSLAVKYGYPGLQAADDALEAEFRRLWSEHVDAVRADAKARGESTKGLISKTYGPEAKAWCWSNVPLDNPVYLAYAGLDAVIARRLVPILIPATGAPEALIRSELWMAGEAARLQMRGFLVDRPLLDEWHGKAKEATEAADFLVRHHTDGLRASQNVKIQAWLETQGVDWSKHPHRTDKGGPSLAGKALKSVLDQPLTDRGRAAVLALLEVQQHADMLSKLTGVLNGLDADGRVHAALNTLEAVTARMSSSGPNMQNFSAQTRGVFLPEPGYVLITCDLDQVELRVTAGLADEPVMKEAIFRGDDLHQLTADLIGVTRPIGKRTNFLVVYGGGANALVEQTGISMEAARSTIDGFWRAYPAIKGFNDAMKTYTKEIRTFSQRRVPVTYTKDGDARSYANLNYMIQSSARDLIARAWWELGRVHGKSHWVWMLIHDEIVLQVKESEVDEAIAIIQKCMTMDFMGVPITATATVLRDENGVSRWLKG